MRAKKVDYSIGTAPPTGGCQFKHIMYITILCCKMAADLKCLCLFLLVLELTLYINICSVLSHSDESYNDALRNNRGKMLQAAGLRLGLGFSCTV